MNQQTDIFAAGEAHSLPPHHDPAIVGAVEIRPTRDRDHVGENAVGKFGNDAIVYVVEVMDKSGAVIFAQSCATDRLAVALANEIGQKLDGNRQQMLFA